MEKPIPESLDSVVEEIDSHIQAVGVSMTVLRSAEARGKFRPDIAQEVRNRLTVALSRLIEAEALLSDARDLAEQG